MNAPGRIVITIRDEGNFQKSFSISPQTGTNQLLDHYRDYLCNHCTDPDKLQFWHGATKIDDTTAGTINIRNGDIIEVLRTEHVTCKTCPVPPNQSSPNVHYLSEADAHSNRSRDGRNGDVRLANFIPDSPDRVQLKFDDNVASSLTLNLSKDTRFGAVLEAWAKHTGRDVGDLRVLFDGKRLQPYHTIREVEKTILQGEEFDDGDKIEVYYYSHGGGQ